MRGIDAIIGQLRLAHPEISADQLAVVHPGADDDGLWFFRRPANDVELYLESGTGNFLFLVENSASVDQLTADTVEQAVTLVITGVSTLRLRKVQDIRR